jgi:hypothetical protein
VTYIGVIAAVLREIATREPGCVFAVVFAGASALTMPLRLPRARRRAGMAPSGTGSAARASLEQGS